MALIENQGLNDLSVSLARRLEQYEALLEEAYKYAGGNPSMFAATIRALDKIRQAEIQILKRDKEGDQYEPKLLLDGAPYQHLSTEDRSNPEKVIAVMNQVLDGYRGKGVEVEKIRAWENDRFHQFWVKRVLEPLRDSEYIDDKQLAEWADKGVYWRATVLDHHAESTLDSAMLRREGTARDTDNPIVAAAQMINAISQTIYRQNMIRNLRTLLESAGLTQLEEQGKLGVDNELNDVFARFRRGIPLMSVTKKEGMIKVSYNTFTRLNPVKKGQPGRDAVIRTEVWLHPDIAEMLEGSNPLLIPGLRVWAAISDFTVSLMTPALVGTFAPVFVAFNAIRDIGDAVLKVPNNGLGVLRSVPGSVWANLKRGIRQELTKRGANEIDREWSDVEEAFLFSSPRSGIQGEKSAGLRRSTLAGSRWSRKVWQAANVWDKIGRLVTRLVASEGVSKHTAYSSFVRELLPKPDMTEARRKWIEKAEKLMKKFDSNPAIAGQLGKIWSMSNPNPKELAAALAGIYASYEPKRMVKSPHGRMLIIFQKPLANGLRDQWKILQQRPAQYSLKAAIYIGGLMMLSEALFAMLASAGDDEKKRMEKLRNDQSKWDKLHYLTTVSPTSLIKWAGTGNAKDLQLYRWPWSYNVQPLYSVFKGFDWFYRYGGERIGYAAVRGLAEGGRSLVPSETPLLAAILTAFKETESGGGVWEKGRSIIAAVPGMANLFPVLSPPTSLEKTTRTTKKDWTKMEKYTPLGLLTRLYPGFTMNGMLRGLADSTRVTAEGRRATGKVDKQKEWIAYQNHIKTNLLAPKIDELVDGLASSRNPTVSGKDFAEIVALVPPNAAKTPMARARWREFVLKSFRTKIRKAGIARKVGPVRAWEHENRRNLINYPAR